MCDRIYKIKFFAFIFLLSGIFPPNILFAQENPEVEAIQLFNTGNFNEAEVLFRQLLEQNPDNPLANYYYGAARTENSHFSETELDCLNAAGKDVTPDRLHYYLGIQHHARENWNQALKYYNLFRISVPETEQQEVELDKKIQLCFNQVNPFTRVSEKALPTADASAVSPPVRASIGTSDNNKEEANQDTILLHNNLVPSELPEDVHASTDLFIPRESLPDLPDVEPTIPAGLPVQFQVNNIITYLFTSQFQTEKGRELFEKGQALQLEQEKKLAEADRLRASYRTTENKADRQAIAAKIIALESESFSLEEDIVTAFRESRSIENAFWEEAGPASKNNFLMEQERLSAALMEETSAENEPEPDNATVYFEASPQPSARTTPSDLIYKIQIGAYSKGVPAYRQRLYNKLSVIRTIENYTDEKGVVVYTTGNLLRYADALKMQNQIKQEGIEDARVVPYFNGKRITLEQAKEIEAQNDI